MTQWLPSEVIATDWSDYDPRTRPRPLREVTADFRCGKCPERYYTAAALEEHVAQVHTPRPKKAPGRPGRPRSACGTETAYRRGCQCLACGLAHSQRMARQRGVGFDPVYVPMAEQTAAPEAELWLG